MAVEAFGVSRFNFFYAARDNEDIEYTALGSTLSSAFTVPEKRGTATLVSTAGLQTGDIIRIKDATYDTYWVVEKVVSGTQVVVRAFPGQTVGTQPWPWGSEIGTAGSSASNKDVTPQQPMWLYIDLTEAPEGETYDYLVYGAASVSCDTANEAFYVDCRAAVPGPESSPYASSLTSPTHVRHRAEYECFNADFEDWYPWNTAFTVTLEAGKRYGFAVEVDLEGITNGTKVRLRSPRLGAMRIDKAHSLFVEAGSGALDANVFTTTNTSLQDALTASVPDPGSATDFLLVGCALIGNTDGTSANREVLIKFDQLGHDFEAMIAGAQTNAHPTWASIGVVSLAAATGFKLQIAAKSAGTARTESPYLAAIPFAAIYGHAAHQSADDTGDATASTTEWVSIDSESLTPDEAGLHTAFVAADLRHNGTTDQTAYARPRFPTDPVAVHDGRAAPRGLVGYNKNNAIASAHQLCFWFHRAHLDAVAQAFKIEGRKRDGSTGGVQVGDKFYATAIRERGQFEPRRGDKSSVVVEVEIGQTYDNWDNPSGVQYSRTMEEGTKLVNAVSTNTNGYTKVATTGALTTDTFHYDVATRLLTIEMDSGESPANADTHVLVRRLALVSRDGQVLTDGDGEDLPYDAGLKRHPRLSRTLQVRDGAIEVASSFGTLELQNAEGTWDEPFAHEILESMRVTVLRGYPEHSSLRADQEVINHGIVSVPDWSQTLLRGRVYDASRRLKWPVAKTFVQVYQGTTQTGSAGGSDGQLMPVIYGAVFRVPAWRTTNETGDSSVNDYQFAAHACHKIVAVYEDGQTQDTMTVSTDKKSTGKVEINNDQFASHASPDPAPDVIYVDVVGYEETVESATGVPIETIGRISRHLLTTFAGYLEGALDDDAHRRIDLIRRRIDSLLDPLERAPSVALYVSDSRSVAECLSQLSVSGWGFWYESRAGRLSWGALEPEAQAITRNGGLEFDSAEAWPWEAAGAGTLALNSTTRFEGVRSLKVDSNGWGWARQVVGFRHPGKWVVTGLVALESGGANGFRLGFVRPGDGLTIEYSDPFAVNDSQWTRANLLTDLCPGESGTGQVVVEPYYPEGQSPQLPQALQAALQMWLRADQMVANGDATSDGDAVTTWTNDGLVSGQDPTQGITNEKPVYRADAWRGHPGVLFDGVDDVLASTYDTSKPYSIFVVCLAKDDAAERDWATTDMGVVGPSASDDNVVLGVRSGDYGARAEPTSPELTDSTAVTSGRPVLLRLSVKTGESRYQLNDGTEQTNTSDPDLTNLAIGGNATAGFWKGYVFEVLVYETELSGTDVDDIQNYLRAKWGIDEAVVNVDNLLCVPVGAAVELEGPPDGTAPFHDLRIGKVAVKQDTFFETRVPYNPNQQAGERTSSEAVTDSQAFGLESTYNPDSSQARSTIATSKRLDLGDQGALIGNEVASEAADSARGVAAKVSRWFGRVRRELQGTLVDSARLPQVGQILYTPRGKRLPLSSTYFPFWVMTKVEDEPNSQEVEVAAEYEVDLLGDRQEVNPTNFPFGGIGVALTDAAIAGWAVVTDMGGKYALGAQTADLESELGSPVHTHQHSHNHTLAAHTHTVPAPTIGIPTATQKSADVSGAARITRAANSHTHATPAGTTSGAVESATVESQVLVTSPGPNDPPTKYVSFRKRVQASATIPTNICIGYPSATVPSGWTRETSLDGWWIRGSVPGRDGTATAPTSSYVPNDSGSTLNLVDGSKVGLGTRLVITEGSNTITVVVTAVIDADSFTVKPVWVVGDDDATYTTGATVTPAAEEAGDTLAQLSHDHKAALPGHTHDLAHAHAISAGVAVGASSGTVDVTGNSGSLKGAAADAHVHEYYSTLASATPTSPSAAGTIAASATNPAPYSEMVFIKPSGSETDVPSDGMIFWQGAAEDVPSEWTVLGTVDGLLVKGAETGLGPVSSGGGHSHVATPAAHGAAAHTHTAVFSNDAVAGLDVLPAAAIDYATAVPESGVGGGSHQHNMANGPSDSANATLDAASGTATDVSAGLPLHGKLLVIQRS